jgi:hypothetical protein
MTDELTESIMEGSTISHGRGYFAGITDAAKMFAKNQQYEQAVAKLMRQYEADHPEYRRIKNEC